MADNNDIDIPASWTPVLDFLQPLETCLSKVLSLGGILFNRAFIFFIGVVAIGVKTFCGFKLKNATTATKALVVIFSAVSLLCLTLFSLGTHIFFYRLLHLADTRFKSLAVLVKTPLMIAVIFGLGYLSKFLEKHDGWNIYAVIFYQCVFVLVTCVMKLLPRGDALGIGGGIIAVSAYLFVSQTSVTSGAKAGYIIATYIVFLFRNIKYLFHMLCECNLHVIQFLLVALLSHFYFIVFLFQILDVEFCIHPRCLQLIHRLFQVNWTLLP